ncbi:hypothetical protein HDU76_009402, partial [Blyttiomyces sp. JEL0837]
MNTSAEIQSGSLAGGSRSTIMSPTTLLKTSLMADQHQPTSSSSSSTRSSSN